MQTHNTPQASISMADGHTWLLAILPTTQSKIVQPAECSSGSGPRWWDALAWKKSSVGLGLKSLAPRVVLMTICHCGFPLVSHDDVCPPSAVTTYSLPMYLLCSPQLAPQHTCVDENMTPKGYHLLRKRVSSSLVTKRVSCTLRRGNSFPGGPRALTRARLSPPLQRLLGRSLNTQKKQKEQHVTLPSLYQQPTTGAVHRH